MSDSNDKAYGPKDTKRLVAVTGAAGFLGSHICRALLRCGYTVRAVTRQGSSRKFPDDLNKRVELWPADIRNVESLNLAFQNTDAVVHNAAMVTIGTDPEDLVRAVNLTGTRNVIKACVDNGVRRLVHIGSIHAFSPLRGRVLDADSKPGQHSKIPYTATKAEAHSSVLEAARSGRINASVICPSSLIGPGDTQPTLVGDMLLAIAQKRLPCLIDEGFWWSDVRDVAAATANAVGQSECHGEVYFTVGRYAKIIELARLCSHILGRRVTRPAMPYFLALAGLPFVQLYAAIKNRPPLYSRNSLDLLRDCPVSVDESSARRQLGYESRPLEESIRDALNWFKEQGMYL